MYLVKHKTERLLCSKASILLVLILSKPSAAADVELVTGMTAAVGQFPFAVAIFCHNMGCIQCTGALLSSKNVITSANCIRSEEISETYYIMAGDVYRIEDKRHVNSSRLFREVIKSVRHPEYRSHDYGSAAYDFSILTVREPYILGEDIKTISIAQSSLPDKALCTYVSFGSESHMHPRGECLHYNILLVDQNRCSSLSDSKVDMKNIYCVQTSVKTNLGTRSETGGFLISRKKPFHLYGVVSKLLPKCEECEIFSNAVTNQNWIHKQLSHEIDWAGDEKAKLHNHGDGLSEKEAHSQGGAKQRVTCLSRRVELCLAILSYNMFL